MGMVRHANHGGVARGGQSWLMVMPDYDMSIAVNINRKTDVFWDFGRISEQLASEFIRANSGRGCGQLATENQMSASN